jgi:hypothetical protein
LAIALKRYYQPKKPRHAEKWHLPSLFATGKGRNVEAMQVNILPALPLWDSVGCLISK